MWIRIIRKSGVRASIEKNFQTKQQMINDSYSVYVHIPFCKARCGYCVFCSYTDFSIEDAYFDALCNEIVRVGDKFGRQPIRTMYWGGGTPSCVKAENLQKLFGVLNAVFDLSGLSEFSVECNPESASEEKLSLFRDIGVNRLSFGLQSANDSTLKKIGRLHNFGDFLTALELAHRLGFSNINADVIIGLPETADEFRRTADVVRKLSLTHLSLYALEIHPEKKAFKKLCDEFGYTDDDLADMYDFATQKLAESGFRRYEVSNFAKAGFECAHNLNYWHEGRYFGFGASASGFVANVRYGNALDMRKYISCVPQTSYDLSDVGVCTEYAETVSPKEEMCEFVMLALRLREGISVKNFRKRFGVDFFDEFPKAKILADDGFLLIESDCVRIPDEKLYVLNSILVELLPD